MRIVHLATDYGLGSLGGAAIASTRLHNALVAAGVDSHYICIRQFEDGPNVHELPPKGTFSRWFHHQLTRLSRGVWKFSSFRRSVSFNVVKLPGLERVLADLRPDVVHVHWLNFDAVALTQLERLPYPTVFHLHDLWMVNGLEPCPGNDRRYLEGYTRENSGFLERKLFDRKRRTIARLKPRFVGPSQWICRSCAHSLVASGCTVTHVHYVFDDRFSYVPERRRRSEKFVILFGCFRGTQNPLKGWEDLMAAVRLLSDEDKEQVEVHVFGEESSTRIEAGVPVIFHGSIANAEQLIDLYHAASVFALPSREDNSPLTKYEALFCGVPVLTYDRRGCPEEIEHGVSGWIAPDGAPAAYAAGIRHFMDFWRENRIDYAGISSRYRTRFATSVIVERMLEVYRSVGGRKLP